jgi:CubicO group peptidase (beta-lactamase class C family)
VVVYIELEVPPSQQADNALASFLNGGFGQVTYLMAPAGRMYNYSNPNFMLAGLVTETVSGEYYRPYLDEHVFTPLGMDRTFFLPDEVIADGDFAYGDTVHWETLEPMVAGPDAYENAWARPAGFAFSSVLDLAEFVLFLRNGNAEVLGDAEREAMQQPQIDTEEMLSYVHYGHGLMIDTGFFLGPLEFFELRKVAHGGAIPGFAADVHYVPALDFGFITLANTDGAYFSSSFEIALKTLCELPPPATRPDLDEDPANYDDYAGEYLDPYGVGTIIVTREGDELRVSMPDLDQAGISYDSLLLPYAPRNFLFTLEGYWILLTFILDAQGTGEYFRTRYFVGTRVGALSGTAPSGSTAEHRAAGAVPEERVRELVQRLRRERPVLPHNVRMRVAEVAGKR